MLDLTKKYTYNGYGVLSIDKYCRGVYKFLVVYQTSHGNIECNWVDEKSKKLVEIKPEPKEVVRWFNAYNNEMFDFDLPDKVGYLDKVSAAQARDKDAPDWLGAFPITITIPED